MTSKDGIKRGIIDNINRKKRDPHNNIDRLEFLISTEVNESTFFELKESIELKNSWGKKTDNYLVMGILNSVLIYCMIKYYNFDEWWLWIILMVIIIVTISYFSRFFESKVILEISLDGLTFDNYVFNKWENIEFLYFKTKYDGEGGFDGTYLVKKLKNGYEHELMIDDLTWSTEELGKTLYQCMRRYGR